MESDILLGAIARLVIALPLVAGLAYLAVKYGFGRRAAGLGRGRRMQVVEQIPLGPKVLMSLVQVGEKYFLLAHQDGSTVVVKEMDELPAEIPGANPSLPGGLFSIIAGKLLRREKNKDEI